MLHGRSYAYVVVCVDILKQFNGTVSVEERSVLRAKSWVIAIRERVSSCPFVRIHCVIVSTMVVYRLISLRVHLRHEVRNEILKNYWLCSKRCPNPNPNGN